MAFSFNPFSGNFDYFQASAIDGSGAATHLAYWLDGDTLTSNANFAYNDVDNILTVGGVLLSVSSQMSAGAFTFLGTSVVEVNNLMTLGIETANTILHLDATLGVHSLPLATYPSLTELSYVKGGTSSFQTQINAKGTFTLPALTAGSVLFSDGTTIAQDNANFNWSNANDTLTMSGSSDNKRFIVKGHSTQTNNLGEFQNSAGLSVLQILNDGTLKVRNRVSGNDGRIELTTGVNPSLDIYGDSVNGYYPQIAFYGPSGLSGRIQGYEGISFAPAAGKSVISTSYDTNAVAFTFKTANTGVMIVPLVRIFTYQGIAALTIDESGAISRYGANAQVTQGFAQPSLNTATAGGTGGTLATATYYYKVAFSNYKGDSIGSNELSVAVTLGQTVTLGWSGIPAGCDHTRVYRSTTAGSYPASSRVDNSTVGIPYYSSSFVDTGYAAVSGTPSSAITFDQHTVKRWAGQTGDFYSFQNESGTQLAAIKNTGAVETPEIVQIGSANNRATGNRILYGATTDAATAVELTTDGATGSGVTNRIAVPTNTTMSVVLNIAVKQSGSANSKQMLRQFLITNNAGTTTIEGAVTVLGTDVGSLALATVTTTITANNTDDCIKVEVNGVAATNLRFTAFLVSCETLYA